MTWRSLRYIQPRLALRRKIDEAMVEAADSGWTSPDWPTVTRTDLRCAPQHMPAPGRKHPAHATSASGRPFIRDEVQNAATSCKTAFSARVSSAPATSSRSNRAQIPASVLAQRPLWPPAVPPGPRRLEVRSSTHASATANGSIVRVLRLTTGCVNMSPNSRKPCLRLLHTGLQSWRCRASPPCQRIALDSYPCHCQRPELCGGCYERSHSSRDRVRVQGGMLG